MEDVISRDALIVAMNAWVPHKDRRLGDIWVAQGALSPAHHALPDPLAIATTPPVPRPGPLPARAQVQAT
jgi:hypothetical protein